MAEIRWFGHNCFRIRAREATVLTDPVGRSTGFAMAKQTADIVTISRDDPALANLAAIKPDYQSVTGPGEYEMHDLFITGIRTINEPTGGERRFNTAYQFTVEGINVCHLGDLGQGLTEEQAEQLSNVDILMIPAGGGDVISPIQAAEVIGQLEPKIVIPMRFRTEIGDRSLGELAEFCKQLGVEVPAAEERLNLRSSEVGETMRVVVLQPESDAVKR